MRSHFSRAYGSEIIYIANSKNQVAGSSAISLSPPTGTAYNDLLVAVILYGSASPVNNYWSAPSGWNEVRDVSGRGVFWRLAATTEVASTFTGNDTANKQGYMLAYRNAKFDTVGTTQASPADAITLSANGGVVILHASRAATASVTWQAQSGFTTVDSDGDATAPSSAIYHKLKQSSGTTGSVTIATASATGFLIGLKPR